MRVISDDAVIGLYKVELRDDLYMVAPNLEVLAFFGISEKRLDGIESLFDSEAVA